MVTTDAASVWAATSSNPDRLVITAGSSGTGSETVSFTVAANAGAPRPGSIAVEGQTFAVGRVGAAGIH